MSEPRTPTGHAQHDLAWEDWSDPEEGEIAFIGGHSAERDGCHACEVIARIEAEAQADPLHRVELLTHDLEAERRHAAEALPSAEQLARALATIWFTKPEDQMVTAAAILAALRDEP